LKNTSLSVDSSELSVYYPAAFWPEHSITMTYEERKILLIQRKKTITGLAAEYEKENRKKSCSREELASSTAVKNPWNEPSKTSQTPSKTNFSIPAGAVVTQRTSLTPIAISTPAQPN